METIKENISRVGNFTSSQIWKLMSNGKTPGTLGKPALTYIQEKNFERKLQQLLDSETNSRPTTWGKLCEEFAFQQLGMDYRLQSQSTYTHPDYECWKGSADCIKFELHHQVVVDIKCPFTRKSFCLFNEITTADELRNNHPDGEAYFWQLVSNAIINNCTHAELIVFMPYKSQLESIRELCNHMPDEETYQYFWIANSLDEDLPYLIDDGYYKNMHIISFEISEDDKQALTDRVAMCCHMLTI